MWIIPYISRCVKTVISNVKTVKTVKAVISRIAQFASGQNAYRLYFENVAGMPRLPWRSFLVPNVAIVGLIGLGFFGTLANFLIEKTIESRLEYYLQRVYVKERA